MFFVVAGAVQAPIFEFSLAVVATVSILFRFGSFCLAGA
jgi:hypothetical protein